MKAQNIPRERHPSASERATLAGGNSRWQAQDVTSVSGVFSRGQGGRADERMEEGWRTGGPRAEGSEKKGE